MLLRFRRGQVSSARRIGERVVIREEAILRRASVTSGSCVTVLVEVEAVLNKPDQEEGTTLCYPGNGS